MIDKRKIIVLILITFSLFMIISSTSAEDVTLNPSNATNFKAIIDSRSSGDNVTLNPTGDYNLIGTNINININKRLTIKSASTSQNAVLNLNNYGNAFQIVSGGNLTLINITIKNGNVSSGGGAISNEGNLTLTGCSFTNNIDTNTWGGGGGAINNGYNGILTANNCSFINNTASLGGAIFNSNSRLNLTGCIFINNSATTDGGGAIYNWGSVTLTSCNFTNNTAISGGAIYNNLNGIINLTINICNFTNNRAISGGNGGAIYHTGGVANLTGCIFRNNAAESGGAIYNNGSNANLIANNCSFTNNSANSGGAIYNTNSSFSLTGCNFTNNTATNDAGAIYNNGNAILTNCILTNNLAIRGGAIFNTVIVTFTTLTVNNCNFTNNNATKGGAIYNNGRANLNGCNFTNNKVTDGNGLFNYGEGGAIYNNNTLIVNNSTFRNNNATNGGAIYNVEGTTLTACNFTNNTASRGSSIYNNGGRTTLTNCTLTNNIASSIGTIYNSGNLTLTNCTFRNNSATNNGGAIYNYGSTTNLTANNCTFTNNTASRGGTIYNDGGSATLTACNFTNNNASDGGVIYNIGVELDNAILTVNNCNFTNNNATMGGVIYNYGVELGNAILTVNNCNFANNTATNRGGVIYNIVEYGIANLTINNCNFTNNSAVNHGGAIYNTVEYGNGAIITATNCTFSNNSVKGGNGGAIYNNLGSLNLTNCNFTNNTAISGGAIYNMGISAYLNATNCNFTNYTAHGGAIYNESGRVNLTNCNFIGDEPIILKTNITINTSSAGGIRQALLDVVIGGTIYLTPGTYTGTNNTNITINKDVTIRGNGSANNVIINAGGLNKIFEISSGVSVTFINITFTGGNNTNGGAIVYTGLTNTNLTVNNCIFENNTATDNGGAIGNTLGTVTLTACTFITNSANFGGAIYNAGGVVTLTGCNFTNNSATNGGAIYNLVGMVNLTNCTFRNNSAIFGGSAIYNSGTLNVSYSVFSNNTGDKTIYIQSGTCYLNDNFYFWVIPDITNTSYVNELKSNITNNINLITSFYYLNITNNSVLFVGDTLNITSSLSHNGTNRNDSRLPDLNNITILYNNDVVRNYNYKNNTNIPITLNNPTNTVGFSYNGILFYEIKLTVQTNNNILNINNTTVGGIRQALEDVFNGGTIYLNQGTYTGNNNTNIIINKTVTIQGNGSANNVIINALGSNRIFTISNGITVTFINITFARGSLSTGGAIYNNGNIHVINCIFENNTATLNPGGAIYNNNSNVNLTNCTFRGNNATSSTTIGGGAIYNTGTSANLTLNNCNFTNNVAGYGGAIWNNGILIVNNCTFTENIANTNGGAIYNSGGTMNVSSSAFFRNNSTGVEIFIAAASTSNLRDNFYFWVIDQNNTSVDPFIAKTINNITRIGTYYYMNLSHIPASTVGQNLILNYTIVHNNGDNVANLTVINITLRNNDVNVNTFNFRTPSQTNIGISITSTSYVLGLYYNGVLFYEIKPTVAITYNQVNITNTTAGGIRQALVSVSNGGTILLNSGTYTGLNNTNITINKNVTIRGNESTNNVIINAMGSTRIFSISSGVSVTFINVTFTGGNAVEGGAISNSGNLTVNNCTFTNNTATEYHGGGAIYNSGSGANLTATNCTFTNNKAISYDEYDLMGRGGAIYNYGYVTLTNCTFRNNSATSEGYGDGGAIYNSGNLTVNNCTFINNSAISAGGAIYNFNANLTVNNCTFTNNSATTAYGGAITIQYGKVNLTNCTFTNNSADRGGAISTINGGNLTANNCTFTNNSAVTNGGAIFNSGSGANLTAINCTFTNNSATNGGAIYNNQGRVNLTNCTFTNNTANGGGAIYSTGSSAILTANYCNFTNYTAHGGAIYNESGIVTLNNCIFINDASISPNSITINTSSVGGIRQALQDVANGGTINLASGTYTGNNNTNITINKNVTLQGNGSANNVIINAMGLTRIFTISNGCSVTFINITFTGGNSTNGGAIYNNGSGANLTATNCNFRNNTATYTNEGEGYGGAIYNSYGSVNLTSCNFTNNTSFCSGAIHNLYDGATLTANNCTFTTNSAMAGGAIANDGGNVTLTNCTFRNNTAQLYSGGAIYNAGNLIVNNCNFTNNKATDTDGGYGGAIYNVVGSVNLTNCTFENNTAHVGGAIFNDEGATLTATNCTFTNNTANNGYSMGGAIYNEGGSINLTGCNFTNNTANVGGAIFNDGYGATLTANNCVFTNNSAIHGGAIFNVGGIVDLTGCNFTNNSANYSGAIGTESGSVTLSACTFINNSASYGGAFSDGDADTIFTANNCVFINNSATNGGAIYTAHSEIVTLTGCTFINNSASYGGAICSEVGIIDLVACTFINNSAGSGGAIFNNGNLSLINCIFSNNTVVGTNSAGGAIYSNGNINLTDCTFRNNTAGWGGAIYNNVSSSSILTGCIFTNNSATATNYGGGAITNWRGTLTANNCNFTNNSATNYGGVIHSYGGSADLTDCTFINNSATNYGGVIYNDYYAGVDLEGCTFINNSGVIYNNDGGIDLTGCTFINNSGVIYNNDGGIDLTGCTFINNSGVIYNNAYLIVDTCIFTNNSASYGVVIYNTYRGSVELSDCNFTNNTAIDSGGVIYNEGGIIDLIDCIFTNNTAIAGWGGAIINFGSINLTNCNFINNSATNGGAIYNEVGSVELIDCNFINNSATNGGAIWNSEGSVDLIDCTFINNTAESGGAIYNNGSYSITYLSADACTFTNNSATLEGGVIYNEVGIVDLIDCTFINNTAESGGVIYNNNGNIDLTGCNFTNNNATYDGGVIFNIGSVDLTGCNFVNNSANSGSAIWSNYILNVSYSVFYNNIGDKTIYSFYSVICDLNDNFYFWVNPFDNDSGSLMLDITNIGYIERFYFLEITTTEVSFVGDTLNITSLLLLYHDYSMDNIDKLPDLNNITIIYKGLVIKNYNYKTETNVSIIINNISNSVDFYYENNLIYTLEIDVLGNDKENTTITVNSVSGVVGSPVMLSANLTSGGVAVVGANVSFYNAAGGLLGSNITNGNGIAVLYYVFNTSMGSTYYAVYEGNGTYNGNQSGSTSLVVNRLNVSLVVSVVSGVVGSSVMLSANLTSGGVAVVGANVSFYNASGGLLGSNITNGNGIAVLYYVFNTSMGSTYYAVYGGNGTYNINQSNNATLVINRLNVSLVVSVVSGVVGSSVMLSANLTSGGVAVVGANVSFYNVGGGLLGSNITNADGIAVLYYVFNTSMGSTYYAVYGGNGTYNINQSNNATLVINRLNVSLVVSVVSGVVGSSVMLSANLTSGGVAVVGANVSFYNASGGLLGSNITNADGIAVLYYVFNTSMGSTYYAVYGGNGTYNINQSNNATLVINKINTNLVVSSVSDVVGSVVVLSAVLTSNSGPVVGANVSFYNAAGTPLGINTTNGSGIAVLYYTFNIGMNTQYYAVYGGNGTYNASQSAYATLVIVGSNTNLVVRDVNGSVGSTIMLSANLTSGGVAVVGANVSFYNAEGILLGINITNGSGIAVLYYTFNIGMNTQYYAVYEGNSTYGGYESSPANLIVNKFNTSLIVRDVNGSVGSSIMLIANLTSNSDPVVGASVSFYNATGDLIGTNTTNANGIAVWYCIFNTDINTNYYANYMGNGTYNGNQSVSASLVIVLVNHVALDAAIDSANTKVQGDYTPASWAIFQTALNRANMLNKDIATQEEVDEVIANLNNAIFALIPVSKDTTPPTVASNVPSGTFFDDVSVVLTMNEPGKIYYTTDGSDPRSSPTRKEYSGPISIGSTSTLRYVAVDTAGNPSQVYQATYTLRKGLIPEEPVQSSGSYNKDVVVSLPTVPGSTLYYKVNDGTYKPYTGAFTIGETATISYYYQDARGAKSSVQTVKYTIDKVALKVKETNTKKFKPIKAKKQTLNIKFSKNIKITKANLKKILVKTSKGKKIKAKVSVKNNILRVTVPKLAKKTKFTVTIPKNIVRDNATSVLKSKTTLRYVVK